MRGFRSRQVLHRLRHERLVGGDHRHRGVGEYGDRIGGGDLLEVEVLERQPGLLQLELQKETRRNVRLDRDGLALHVGDRS